ncbi:MAG: hypothetical protein JWO31_3231, partial [Phycisphaerales bacterium]|nr:hypothetical protein [Phycisphaerales bacterium]
DPTAGRHRRLYAAARNLAELGCPPALAHALLTDPALDCGLTPADARRQVDCGVREGWSSPAAAPGTPAELAMTAGPEGGAT